MLVFFKRWLLGIALIAAILSAFWGHRLVKTVRPRTEGSLNVGVFLLAQHQVINDIYGGFRKEFDSVAATRKRVVRYIVRNADGQIPQVNAIASFFRSEKVDLIFVVGLPAAQALKGIGLTVPVVFGGPPDPVGSGLVPSLRGHRTNFTGTRYLILPR